MSLLQSHLLLSQILQHVSKRSRSLRVHCPLVYRLTTAGSVPRQDVVGVTVTSDDEKPGQKCALTPFFLIIEMLKHSSATIRKPAIALRNLIRPERLQKCFGFLSYPHHSRHNITRLFSWQVLVISSVSDLSASRDRIPFEARG